MPLKIALAGNPNCGKTTLFNVLTGSNQFVGNWPGVTVEYKEGKLRGYNDVIVTDLPGIYSLSPYTLEEVVARNYLVNELPDAILDIVDGTNIERNLYLTTQLIELGIPVVVAVNMMDIVRRKGDKINIDELSRQLKCPVVEISALKNEGIDKAADIAVNIAKSDKTEPLHIFSGNLEHTIAHIEEAAVHDMPEERQRWYAIKIFERDVKVLEQLKLSKTVTEHIEKDIAKLETQMDDDAESIITNERYEYIERILKPCYKKRRTRYSSSDKIDSIVTNRILALPIFFAIMLGVYALSMGTIGNLSVGFMNDTVFGKWIIPGVTVFLEKIGCAGWLISLIADGIISGVGAVLGFVPQMLILFFLLYILEDIGYMSRVAFIMDKIFRKFGLSGKSFIPLLVASGCGVPGIMASRTIDRERDRKMTIMTTCFIPCGAKMPLIALISGALFGNSPIIATSAYFIGICSVIVSGIILKKTKLFAGEPSPFVMELPPYHVPSPKNIFRGTWERGWSFIKRAGTVIVVAGVIVWILNSLSFEGGLHYIADTNTKSILNSLSEYIMIIFKPLGFGKWQATVATLLGLVAKEEVVGVFGSLSSMLGDGVDLLHDVNNGLSSSAQIIGAEFFDGSRLAGYSFMIFNLLCAPCSAAMAAIRREMNSGKWALFAIAYMTSFAYAVSLCIFQIGSFITSGLFTFGTFTALIVIFIFIYFIFRKTPNISKSKKRNGMLIK